MRAKRAFDDPLCQTVTRAGAASEYDIYVETALPSTLQRASGSSSLTSSPAPMNCPRGRTDLATWSGASCRLDASPPEFSVATRTGDFGANTAIANSLLAARTRDPHAALANLLEAASTLDDTPDTAVADQSLTTRASNAHAALANLLEAAGTLDDTLDTAVADQFLTTRAGNAHAALANLLEAAGTLDDTLDTAVADQFLTTRTGNAHAALDQPS